jgi:poly(3-hydroxybutyrate) depolymerase
LIGIQNHAVNLSRIRPPRSPFSEVEFDRGFRSFAGLFLNVTQCGTIIANRLAIVKRCRYSHRVFSMASPLSPVAASVFRFMGIIILMSDFAYASGPVISVTITQRAPIEALAPDGSVVGVKESTVGAKMTLVSADASQVTLQDTDGTHYLIAIADTDYAPPAATAPATTTNSTPSTNSIVQTPASAAPVPPSSTPVPPPAPPAAATTTTPDQALPSDNTPTIITVGDRKDSLAVWPPGGIAGGPLLVASHGRGGTGPNEIKGWITLARQHRFTIVCPTLAASATNSINIPQDQPFFTDCLKWIGGNLQYDKDNAYMTGFSGGGFSVWYLGTAHSEFFHGLFLQSGNFSGPQYFDFSLSKWFNRPIKLIWGSADLPDIPVQNQQALDALKEADCKNYTSEVIPGGHHQEHRDLVVDWMEQQVASASSSASSN